MSGDVIIRVENVKKYYNDGKVKALDGVSTEIRRGEVVVIIGPSGGGKSTLLRSLNLLEEPTEGKIYFEGENITDPKIDIDLHRQKMGMVFQHFNLFPHMTILHNMTLAPMRVLKRSKQEAEAKAIEKYLNTVNTSKDSVTATYTKLYSNTYLDGAAKTGLKSAKDVLDSSISALISSINTAIADEKTTASEKADVDKKFAAFNTAMSSFESAVETANKYIQDKLKDYTDTATNQVKVKLESDLSVQAGQITGISTRVDNIRNEIDTAGWINTTQGNTLFAAKSLENGDNIISYINQTATTTTIKAERIDLVGVVTISMLDSDLRDTINDTVFDVNKASDITSAFYRFSNDGMSLNRRIEVGSGSIDNLSVKGGISPDVNNVCFWTGGTYGQAVNNEAKIVLRHDGSGFLANKNISWDTSGDLSIIGKIQTSDNGNRIIIDPSTRSIRMINDKNSLAGEILFNDMTGYQSLPAFHIYMRNASSGVSNYRVSMGYFGFGSYDNGGNVLFNISPSGLMTFPYMSTVDPKVKGAIWRDGNMLKISLG